MQIEEKLKNVDHVEISDNIRFIYTDKVEVYYISKKELNNACLDLKKFQDKIKFKCIYKEYLENIPLGVDFNDFPRCTLEIDCTAIKDDYWGCIHFNEKLLFLYKNLWNLNYSSTSKKKKFDLHLKMNEVKDADFISIQKLKEEALKNPNSILHLVKNIKFLNKKESEIYKLFFLILLGFRHCHPLFSSNLADPLLILTINDMKIKQQYELEY